MQTKPNTLSTSSSDFYFQIWIAWICFWIGFDFDLFILMSECVSINMATVFSFELSYIGGPPLHKINTADCNYMAFKKHTIH